MRSNSGPAHEDRVLLVGAEAHDALDAGPVVPGAVEQTISPNVGQVLDVALEVPLPLGRRRLGQRDHPRRPRVQVLGEPLDRAALAGGVAALEDHDVLGAACPGSSTGT
jgi:hypothetical protein